MSENTAPVHIRTGKRNRYSPANQWFGRTALRVLGWKLVAEESRVPARARLPRVPKCVVACAPHTSNWDLPLTLLAARALNLPCVFMAKHTVFWWPLGAILRWLGGIPIDRRASEGIVEQMAQVIRESERINVVITPEGTRKDVEYWKLGFYWIALRAGVPILFGAMSYKEKWIGTVELFYPTGNLDEDWRHITEVFERTAGVTPKYRPRSAPNQEDRK